MSSQRFYDRAHGSVDDVPDIGRPSKILYFHIRRRIKMEGLAFTAVCAQVAEAAALGPSTVSAIAGGKLPTPAELRALQEGLGWTLMFMFGVTERAFDESLIAICHAARLVPNLPARLELEG